MTKKLGFFMSLAGFISLFLWLLLVFTGLVAGSRPLYLKCQEAAGVGETYGIERTDLERYDTALIEYINGDREALNRLGAFNEREVMHMNDVFELFVLSRVLRIWFLACAVIFIVVGMSLSRKVMYKAGLTAAGVFALPFILFGLWGVINFDSLFTGFHNIAFTNSLWQLDPATDLLIRLCPINLFYVSAIVVVALTFISVALTLAIVRRLKWA